MHCSVWRFVGDPDDLEQRYLALITEVPESNHVLHAAAKTADGLLIFDTGLWRRRTTHSSIQRVPRTRCSRSTASCPRPARITP